MSEKYQVYLDIFLSADAKLASVAFGPYGRRTLFAMKGGLSPPRSAACSFVSLKITQTTKTKYIKSLFLKKNLSFWRIGEFIVPL